MKKNGVVHFEIYADDPEKLGKFYTSLFDWTIDPIPGMDYWYIKTVETDAKGRPTQPGAINGGMMKRPAGYNERPWMNYVNVDSIEESAARVEKLGATVMKGKTPVPGIGWFAMLTDPQGNFFAIWQMDPNAK